MKTVAEIRTALKMEGYPDDGSLRGPGLSRQLKKLIAEAKRKSPSG